MEYLCWDWVSEHYRLYSTRENRLANLFLAILCIRNNLLMIMCQEHILLLLKNLCDKRRTMLLTLMHSGELFFAQQPCSKHVRDLIEYCAVLDATFMSTSWLCNAATLFLFSAVHLSSGKPPLGRQWTERAFQHASCFCYQNRALRWHSTFGFGAFNAVQICVVS